MRQLIILLFCVLTLPSLAATSFTQGEAPTLSLTAQNGSTAFDLTGASLQTKFLKEDGRAELTIANGSHTITDATAGEFTVDLTAAETAQVQVGARKTLVTIATIGGKDYYFWGRKALTVYSPLIRDQ